VETAVVVFICPPAPPPAPFPAPFPLPPPPPPPATKSILIVGAEFELAIIAQPVPLYISVNPIEVLNLVIPVTGDGLSAVVPTGSSCAPVTEDPTKPGTARLVAAATPKTGVTRVGLVLSTLATVPVEEVTPVPPLATASVPATVTAPDVAPDGVSPVVPNPTVVTPPAAGVCQVAAVLLVAIKY
jgi:hypothetical protein